MPAPSGEKPPSYVAKLWRAKTHLADLEDAVRVFAADVPYTVDKRVDARGRATYHLVFTRGLDGTAIPLIAADLIMNIRASLDHLMNALVHNRQRGKVMFPVYFKGVWENAAPGDSPERVKSRERWVSDTKSVHREALTVLKALQPTVDAADTYEPSMLRSLNALANRDRHQRLPIVVAGLRDVEYTITTQDGSVTHAQLTFEEKTLLVADAELPLPRGTITAVTVRGVPEVLIELRKRKPGLDALAIDIPRALRETVAWVEEQLFPLLVPYVQTGEWVGAFERQKAPLEQGGEPKKRHVAGVVARMAAEMEHLES